MVSPKIAIYGFASLTNTMFCAIKLYYSKHRCAELWRKGIGSYAKAYNDHAIYWNYNGSAGQLCPAGLFELIRTYS